MMVPSISQKFKISLVRLINKINIFPPHHIQITTKNSVVIKILI